MDFSDLIPKAPKPAALAFDDLIPKAMPPAKGFSAVPAPGLMGSLGNAWDTLTGSDSTIERPLIARALDAGGQVVDAITPDAFQRGAVTGRQSVAELARQSGVGPQNAMGEGAATAAHAVDFVQQEREKQNFPQDPANEAALSAMSNAKSVGEWASAVTPGAVGDVVLESFGQQAPVLAASLMGGPVSVGANAAGSLGIEYAGAIRDAMSEQGVDTNDPAAVRAFFADPKAMDAAKASGLKRGIPIAAFDAATAGIAGKFFKGTGLGKVLMRSGTDATLGAAGGMAGEATAQYADTGEVKLGDVLTEGVAEGPSGVIEGIGNVARDARPATPIEAGAQAATDALQDARSRKPATPPPATPAAPVAAPAAPDIAPEPTADLQSAVDDMLANPAARRASTHERLATEAETAGNPELAARHRLSAETLRARLVMPAAPEDSASNGTPPAEPSGNGVASGAVAAPTPSSAVAAPQVAALDAAQTPVPAQRSPAEPLPVAPVAARDAGNGGGGVPASGDVRSASVAPLDYSPRLTELRRTANRTPEQQTEYTSLLETDRITGKVGGLPMPGVRNMSAYRDAEEDGQLLPVRAFLDADNFKRINDELGHGVGDDAIRQIATVLRDEMGADKVFHRSGDEFLMHGATPEELNDGLARVRERLAGATLQITLPDGSVKSRTGVSFSYGLGKSESEAEDAQVADKKSRAAAGLRTERRGLDQGADSAPDAGGAREGEGAIDRATEEGLSDGRVSYATESIGAQGLEAKGRSRARESSAGPSSDVGELQRGTVSRSRGEGVPAEINANEVGGGNIASPPIQAEGLNDGVLLDSSGRSEVLVRGNGKNSRGSRKAVPADVGDVGAGEGVRGFDSGEDVQSAPVSGDSSAPDPRTADGVAGGAATSRPDLTDQTPPLGGVSASTPRESRAPSLSVDRIARIARSLFAGYDNAPQVEVVANIDALPERLREDVLESQQEGAEGLFDPKTNRVYLIADNLSSLDRARWVAFHEIVGHYGIRGVLDAAGKGVGAFHKELTHARTNPTIGALAKAVAADRGFDLDRNPALLNLATEEAMAELSAAEEAGDFDHIAERYGVEIPARMRPGITSALLRFLDRIKALLRLIDPRTEAFSDADWRKLMQGARRYVRSEKATTVADDATRLSTPPRTQAQKDALTKAGLSPDNRTTIERLRDKIAEQWQSVRDILASNIRQRVFDRFDRMNAIEQTLGVPPEHSAYISARLSAGLPSIMEGVMLYGAPEWQGGVLGQKADTVGLLDALKPVEADIDGWLGWMVGRRAKVLKAQGRENLMSDADIEALLSLAKGKEAAFQKAAHAYLQIKEAVLDVAEEAGLIDPVGRATWDSVEYIPFYRADDSDQTLGPGTRKALTNQSSGIRQLKGGNQNLADPLGNIIRNFTRLIDASLKNHAMLQAVDQYGPAFFEKVGMSGSFEKISLSQIKQLLLDRGVPQATIDSMPQGTLTGLQKLWAVKPPTDDDVVRVMRDGSPEYYRVPDPDLLLSLTSFKAPNKHWAIKPFIFAKRLLTAGVTSSPEFMARNFIRDSGSAWMISDDNFRLGWDSAAGLLRPMLDDSDQRAMMLAGGSFIGGQIHGGSPDETAAALRRALRKKGLTSQQIEDHLTTIARTPLQVWDKWQAIGSRLENANRNAVYKAAIDAGRSPKEAAYLARDLMDFALQGDSRIIQGLADVLPFFNARLQGLYKLYRQGGKKKLRKALLARAASITLTTLALLAWNSLMYADAYDELEEWDKDTYWHIAPGTEFHTRIPKPFELGVLFATVPERVARLAFGKDRIGQFSHSMWTQISGTLAMNPVPQALMPIVELWANRSAFTNRPIENMGDEQLLPEARAEWYTSDVAKVISDHIGNATNLSPKRIEHLWNGYTGTVGGYALDTVDWLVRQVQSQPERPELAWAEMPLLKALYRGDLTPKSTRYTTEFYELLNQANDVSGTIKEFTLAGRDDDAAELEAKWSWLLGEREDSKRAKAGFMHTGVREFNKARDRLSDIRKQIEGIVAMPGFTDEEKRAQIDVLAAERNELTKRVTAAYRARQQAR